MPLFGWKYNMDNIQAAMLLGQLKKIDEYWLRRDAATKLYRGGLGSTPGVNLLPPISGSRHGRHIMPIFVSAACRDSLLWALQERGIGVGVHYRPIHLLKFYQETYGYRCGMFPVAEQLGNREISLPLYPKITENQIDYVLTCLRQALDSQRQSQM